MANQIRKIYQELQAQSFDMRALLRLATWGCAAAAALMLAVFSAYSTARSQSQTVAVAPQAEPAGAPRSPPAITAQLAARAADMENEARRLSEAVLALTADRDQLLTRVASLERGLEDVTGSVKRQAAAPPPPASPAAPQLPAIAFAPAPLAGGTPRRAEPEPVSLPARVELPPPPTRLATIPVATTPAAGVADEEQAKGEFAVDVGGAVNFDGLRVLWNSSRNANAVLFEGLQPLVAARENRSRGVDLRLIVGPLASTEAATQICAALLAARRSCQMTTYEGQPLPLTAPPEPDRQSERQPERRPATTTSRNSGQSKTRTSRP
jgi:hypothetical protein